jgi:hypothetical protein
MHRSKQHLYWITSSAWVSSVGGMVTPSPLAVLRLNGSGPAPTYVAFRRAHVAYRHQLTEQLVTLTEPPSRRFVPACDKIRSDGPDAAGLATSCC